VGGQLNSSGSYTIFRTLLYFDTSSLPYGATVTGWTLSVYVSGNYAANNFYLVAQQGSNSHPSTPSTSGDYWQGWYSGNGGSLSTSNGLSQGSYWNITGTSLGWITTGGGYTIYALRSSDDIAGVVPSGNEYLILDGCNSQYPPLLYVSYTYTAAYTYVTSGPYYENGTVASANVSITLYKRYDPPETRILTGSANQAGVQTWYVANLPYYFMWNISASYMNQSRTFWVNPNVNFQNIYVYIPAQPYQTYSFKVNDLVGLQHAYLSSTIIVAGVTETVECQPIILSNPSIFTMTQFNAYDMIITCDQGTVDTGPFTPETNYSPTLAVTSFSFPIQYNYYNVSVTATRPNPATMQAYYSDGNFQTTNGTLTILDSLGTTAYTQSWTGNAFQFSYTSLDNNTDYTCQIVGQRLDGQTYMWNLALPVPQTSTNIFSALDQLFPTNPVTITMWNGQQTVLINPPVSTFFALLIIFSVFAVFSYYLVELAAFLAVLVTAILTYMNWITISPTIITIAFVIVAMLAIKRGKRMEREV
jgi:hypothetical protein